MFTQGADSTIVASEGNVHVYPVDALIKDELVDTNGERCPRPMVREKTPWLFRGRRSGALLVFMDVEIAFGFVYCTPSSEIVRQASRFGVVLFLNTASKSPDISSGLDVRK